MRTARVHPVAPEGMIAPTRQLLGAAERTAAATAAANDETTTPAHTVAMALQSVLREASLNGVPDGELVEGLAHAAGICCAQTAAPTAAFILLARRGGEILNASMQAFHPKGGVH